MSFELLGCGRKRTKLLGEERAITITPNLKPEVEAELLAEARATGLTIEQYVEQLVELPFSGDASRETDAVEGSGTVWENGVFVYRTERPLPASVVEDAVRRSERRA